MLKMHWTQIISNIEVKKRLGMTVVFFTRKWLNGN